MATIDPTSTLLAQIRLQLAAANKASRVDTQPQTRKLKPRANQQQNPAGLVLQRVASIDPNDPDSRRKAFRFFLESVLLNELGEDLLSDPAFYRLVDQVQQTMEAEEKLRGAIDQAGKYLLDQVKR